MARAGSFFRATVGSSEEGTMRWQATSWCEGWKIGLRCTEFKCQDGSRMFASTATFEHLPGPKELWTPMLPNAAAPSVVHTEEAFGTCEEANADALDRARHEIFALNGARPLGVRKSLGNVLCNVSHQESDESLAASLRGNLRRETLCVPAISL